MRYLALMLLLALTVLPVQAGRFALVVGIDDYDLLPRLDKAVGDAEAMSTKLEELGFAVTTSLNVDRRQFNQVISDFVRLLGPEDVALFHFSGHGIEIAGRNLLLPRDTPLPKSGSEDFLIAEAIDLSILTGRVAESKAAVRIFVIDACRNNPFAQKGVRGLGGAGGLSPVASSRGSFILYSAGYAQTALDRLGPSDLSQTSVYTRVLIDLLGTPGVSISEVARSVRAEVSALAEGAGHEQSPAYYDELTQDFVLAPEAPSNSPREITSIEASAFDRARYLGTAEALEVFLATYPDGIFSDLARTALADVAKRKQMLSSNDSSLIVDLYAARNRLNGLWEEGRRFINSGANAQAFAKMSDARILAKAYFGPNSEEYADANNRIVEGLSAVGRLDEAIEASREAIRVYSRLFGESDPRVLNEKGNLAGRLAIRSEVAEATELFEQLLSAYSEMELQGEEVVAYASVLEGYGSLSLRKRDVEKAERLLAQAMALLERARLTDTLNYGLVVARYGRLMREQGNCEKARNLFQTAVASLERAGISRKQGDFSQALSDLRQDCPA